MVRDENQGGSLRNISKSGSARGHSKRDGPDVRRQGDGISLVVQWLRLCASNAGYAGSIPGRGIKMPQAVLCGQKIKKKKKKRERGRREPGGPPQRVIVRPSTQSVLTHPVR